MFKKNPELAWRTLCEFIPVEKSGKNMIDLEDYVHIYRYLLVPLMKRAKSRTGSRETHLRYPEIQKTYRGRNPEKARGYGRKGSNKYLRTDKGHIITEKRLMRFSKPQICLNKWKPGTAGHHIDFHHIVYIPESIHRAFPHNLMEPDKNLDILKSVAYAELYIGGKK